MRGVPAWHQQRSGQHPSSVLPLRGNPPSPTRGEGRSLSGHASSASIDRAMFCLACASNRCRNSSV
ncbi:MAG: hypothetical protein E5X89_01875 [Mesorhizobium sp.]|nr:MAG: hypothetical protein E5X88_04930 [Mesorhizobium sp.]TIO36769.1 MAG: hypothetical protein E5X89_01875 [Mesorhizobium sp.]TIP13801.1 MAG: hypothetical protein E5X73_06805 [Mesorhizobium sp.]